MGRRHPYQYLLSYLKLQINEKTSPFCRRPPVISYAIVKYFTIVKLAIRLQHLNLCASKTPLIGDICLTQVIWPMQVLEEKINIQRTGNVMSSPGQSGLNTFVNFNLWDNPSLPLACCFLSLVCAVVPRAKGFSVKRSEATSFSGSLILVPRLSSSRLQNVWFRGRRLKWVSPK